MPPALHGPHPEAAPHLHSSGTRKPGSAAGTSDGIAARTRVRSTAYPTVTASVVCGPRVARPPGRSFAPSRIDLAGQSSTEPRTYHQQVDHVPHVEEQVRGPAEIGTEVDRHHSSGTTYEDTGPATGTAFAQSRGS